MNKLEQKILELKEQLIVARSSMSVEFAKKMYDEIGYGAGGHVSNDRIQKFIKENTEKDTHSFISKKEVEELKHKVLIDFNALLNKYEVKSNGKTS